THPELIVLVVGVVLLGTRHLLAVQRMCIAALHQDHHCLVHLVGDDYAEARLTPAPLVHRIVGVLVDHAGHLGLVRAHQRLPSSAVCRSVRTVFMRAMSRRSVRSSIGLSISCVTERKRRRKISSS